MMYCPKHAHWYSGRKCEKCIAGEEPYLRMREEVANPDEWKRYKRRGWTR